MKTKHTPGPWKTDLEICESKGGISVYAMGPVVYVYDNTNGPEEQKANAKLIASAPDLLKVCNDAMVWTQGDIKAFDDITPTKEMLYARIEVLKQAIAKATT